MTQTKTCIQSEEPSGLIIQTQQTSNTPLQKQEQKVVTT